jgi:hypothetical protein
MRAIDTGFANSRIMIVPVTHALLLRLPKEVSPTESFGIARA